MVLKYCEEYSEVQTNKNATNEAEGKSVRLTRSKGKATGGPEPAKKRTEFRTGQSVTNAPNQHSLGSRCKSVRFRALRALGCCCAVLLPPGRGPKRQREAALCGWQPQRGRTTLLRPGTQPEATAFGAMTLKCLNQKTLRADDWGLEWSAATVLCGKLCQAGHVSGSARLFGFDRVARPGVLQRAENILARLNGKEQHQLRFRHCDEDCGQEQSGKAASWTDPGSKATARHAPASKQQRDFALLLRPGPNEAETHQMPGSRCEPIRFGLPIVAWQRLCPSSLLFPLPHNLHWCLAAPSSLY